MLARPSSADYAPEPPGELLAARALLGTPVAMALLRELARQQAPVGLRRRDDLRVAALARLVECGTDRLSLRIEDTPPHRATLGTPCTDDDDIAEDYVAVAFLDGIKIQFDARLRAHAAPDGGHWLQGTPPQAVYRLQRREAYRIALARGGGRCVLRKPADRELPFELVDLSARGLSLTWTEDGVPPPGTVWEHARIEVPGKAPVPCCLVVCRIDRDGAREARIACEFVRLPPENERAIQVLVNDLQRESRLRERAEQPGD